MEILVGQSIGIADACYEIRYIFDDFIAVATFERGFRKVPKSDIVARTPGDVMEVDWLYTGNMERVVDLEEYVPEA